MKKLVLCRHLPYRHKVVRKREAGGCVERVNSLIQFIFHGCKKTLTVANADGYFFIRDLDLAFTDMLDLADRDDVGAVCPDEFAGKINLDIIIEPFDIENFLQVDLDHLVVRFDENISFL